MGKRKTSRTGRRGGQLENTGRLAKLTDMRTGDPRHQQQVQHLTFLSLAARAEWKITDLFGLGIMVLYLHNPSEILEDCPRFRAMLGYLEQKGLLIALTDAGRHGACLLVLSSAEGDAIRKALKQIGGEPSEWLDGALKPVEEDDLHAWFNSYSWEGLARLMLRVYEKVDHEVVEEFGSAVTEEIMSHCGEPGLNWSSETEIVEAIGGLCEMRRHAPMRLSLLGIRCWVVEVPGAHAEARLLVKLEKAGFLIPVVMQGGTSLLTDSIEDGARLKTVLAVGRLAFPQADSWPLITLLQTTPGRALAEVDRLAAGYRALLIGAQRPRTARTKRAIRPQLAEDVGVAAASGCPSCDERG